jgi:hypothetical protein
MKCNNQPERGDEGTGYEEDYSPFIRETALWLPSLRVTMIRPSWLFGSLAMREEMRSGEK